MLDLPSLRREYGSVFVTNLESGDVIPWKQLNMGEYLEYSILLENGIYAKATIEDEIFKKCVLDDYIIDSLSALKAGTVSTVVQDIINNSGPRDTEDLNITLQIFRTVANQAIHQTAAFICRAFPAYKPEDVYALEYGDFVLRLAQAESKLMQEGLLQEPINFHDPTKEVQKEEPEEKKGAMDLYNEYLEQQDITKQETVIKTPRSDQTIITDLDSKSLGSEMSGHEREDAVIEKNKMLQDAAEIYKDYLDQTSSGGKLEIKTPEERLAAAEIRAKENQVRFAKSVQQQKVAQDAVEEKYAQVFKRAAAKKK